MNYLKCFLYCAIILFLFGVFSIKTEIDIINKDTYFSINTFVVFTFFAFVFFIDWALYQYLEKKFEIAQSVRKGHFFSNLFLIFSFFIVTYFVPNKIGVPRRYYSFETHQEKSFIFSILEKLQESPLEIIYFFIISQIIFVILIFLTKKS